MKPSWNLVLLAFLSGCLLGGALGIRHEKRVFHHFWEQGPDTQRLLSKLSRKLDLNPQQEDQVRSILETQRQKVLVLHQEMSVQFDAIRMAMRKEMEKTFTPEQQKKFTEMTQQWDARHQHKPLCVIPNSPKTTRPK